MVKMKLHPVLGIMVRSDGMVLHPAVRKCRGHVVIPEYWTKGFYDKDGYRRIILNKKKYAVHRLVLEAFEPEHDGKPFVDHIDRVRDNNSLENLRWVTQLENNYNTSRSLPIGKRKCDAGYKEYKLEYQRKYRVRRKGTKNV